MKRTIIAAGVLALAGGFFFMPNAIGAECAEGDTVSEDIGIGVVCAGGDATAASGHVYVDGHETNEVEPTDGYIGVANDVRDGEGGVYGCAEGDWTDTDADGNPETNLILDPQNPSTDPPDPNSPCAPSGP